MKPKARLLCIAVALLAQACSSSDESSAAETGAACSDGQCGGCNGCVATCVCNLGAENSDSCAQVCASAGGAGGAGGSGATSAGGSGGSGAGSSAGGSGGSGVSGSGGTGGSGAGGVGGADPSAPIVEIPGLPCGGVIDANLASPFVELGGRQVFVDYACGKARGTPVTFILNLHGTMAQESGRHYIRGYFPTHQYTDSHNLIIATPKSVVSQWGNQDGGQDEPHVMAVIDWMYETFAGFDIRHMWIVGHSWGAMYARTFACKTELADKVHGVVLMSGGSSMPACADRLAALGTVGETDIVPGELNQGAAASAHACAAQTTLTLGNNRVTHWPSCGPGWVHKNYFMLGKGHGFSPVDWPDSGMNDDMVAAIVSTR